MRKFRNSYARIIWALLSHQPHSKKLLSTEGRTSILWGSKWIVGCLLSSMGLTTIRWLTFTSLRSTKMSTLRTLQCSMRPTMTQFCFLREPTLINSNSTWPLTRASTFWRWKNIMWPGMTVMTRWTSQMETNS
mgnify:CR=1 FL=1